MANCVLELLDENSNIIYIQPNVVYNGEISGFGAKDLYRYEMYENETMTFNIRIYPQTSQPISAELTLYRVNGNTLAEIGTATMNEFYNTFTYDGTIGEYRFCITSTYHIKYELVVEFTDYPFILFPEFDMYHGAYMPPFEFAKKASKCDSQVFYRIIEGELPPGLSMNASGVISGVIEEMDCHTPKDIPPSFTWYKEDEDAWVSTTYDYHFVVRAALVDAPGTYADREFFICVRNNWDYDRDAYMAALNNFERTVYIKSQPVGGSVEDYRKEPEVDEEPKVPTLSEEELKALCECVQINEEYKGLVRINNNCVECIESEEEILELKQIAEYPCVPCITVEKDEGLKEIPTSLCACETEEPEPVEEKKLEEGIPEFCLTEFLVRMRNEKVCSSHITCPVKPPIFPEYEEMKPELIKSQCELECEDKQ